MKLIRLIAALIAASFLPVAVLAQTAPTPSSATVTLTVTAAPVPANVTATLAAPAVQAGGTASVTVKVSGNVGTPSGSIDLQVMGPGQTGYTTLNTFPLAGGSVTCTYPIPVTAPAGAYSLKAIYVPPVGGAYY